MKECHKYTNKYDNSFWEMKSSMDRINDKERN